MKPRKNKDSFWLSYSDLMTSLFFIMLVLFVVCTAKMSGLVNLPDDVKELREELLAVRKENKSLKNENETLCDKVNHQQEILDGYQATQEQYERILLIQNMFKSLTEGIAVVHHRPCISAFHWQAHDAVFYLVLIDIGLY